MAEAAKARGQELKYLRDKFHTPPQFGAPTATGSNGSLVVNASGLKGVTSVSAKVRYPTYVLDTTPPKYPVGADGRVSIVRPNLLEGTKGDKVTVAITCVPEPINSVAKKLGVPPNEPQTFVREFRT